MSSVCQGWVLELSGKMQSVLLLGLRGCDTQYLPNVKKLGRWLRGVVLVPSDPDNPQFMFAGDLGRIEEKSDLAHELEFCPVHYYSHLMHSFEIVGYEHLDPQKRLIASRIYADMCRLLHLPTETKGDMQERLSHKEWPNGKQPKSFDDVQATVDKVKKALQPSIPRTNPPSSGYGGSHN